MRIYKQSDLNVFFIESVSDAPVSDVAIERSGEFISIKRPRLGIYDIKDVHYLEIQDANGYSFTSAMACEAYLNTQLGVVMPSGGGSAGPAGQAATVTVGSTTTSAAGSSASVTNSGTSSAAVLNFIIPRGATGAAGADSTVPGPVGPASTVPGPKGSDGVSATVSVGTVTTLASGSSATVTNSGTTMAAVLNFGVPRGADALPVARYAARIATTGTTGIINVTFPTGRFSGVPVVSCDVECPTADASGYSYRCEFIGAPTATSCQIRVTRQATTLVVSILGAVITTINAAPAGVVVNVIATDVAT